MHITSEQLNAIEEYAYRLFPPSIIAISLEVDESDLLEEIRSTGTPVHVAYYKGYIRQLDETRTDTIKAARNGSNPAQIELLKFIRETQNELKYG